MQDLLGAGTSPAARYLRANGITLFGVRDATVELLGKADMYYFSAEHPPLTEPAQRALDWAVEEHLRSGREGEVLTEDLLVGIWNQKGSAGHQILEKLGFNDSKAAEVKNLVSVENADRG